MKRIVIVLFIFALVLIFKTSEYVIIPDESIRFRIISSSNKPEDIYMKKVLTKEIVTLLNNINDKKDIKNNIELIDDKVKSILLKYEYNKNYEIKYGDNYFPKKVFKGVLYNDGYYESLVITLGEGNGSNFWCVLFPPLCKMEVEDESKDVEYRFKVKEIIDKFLNKI